MGQGGESVFLCLSMVVQNIVSFSSMCSFHSEIILCELDATFHAVKNMNA